jgi:raffinose/stachyose/melibiose transport system substrate-binding protein
MKKGILLVGFCFVLVITLILSGCSGQKGNGANQKSSEIGHKQDEGTQNPVESNKGKKISLLIGSVTLTDTEKKLFESFQTDTGIELDVQIIPGAASQYSQIVQSKIATKDYPDLLVYFGSPGYMPAVKPSESMVEITNNDWISKVQEGLYDTGGTYNEKTYGIPFSGVDFVGLLYNEKVFNELSLKAPENFDELVDVCQRIKDSGTDIIPIYEMGKQGGPLLAFTLTDLGSYMATNEGKEMIEKINTNQLNIESTKILDSFKRKMLLQEKGYFNYDQDMMTGTWDTLFKALAEKKAAMSFVYSNVLPSLYQNYPDIDVNMTALDGTATSKCTLFIYIMKTDNEEVSNEFIKYYLKEDTLNVYYNELKAISPFKGIYTEMTKPINSMYQYYKDSKIGVFCTDMFIMSPGPFIPLLQEMHVNTKTPEAVAIEMSNMIKEFGKEMKFPGF